MERSFYAHTTNLAMGLLQIFLLVLYKQIPCVTVVRFRSLLLLHLVCSSTMYKILLLNFAVLPRPVSVSKDIRLRISLQFVFCQEVQQKNTLLNESSLH